jgi:hypothetical protein
MCARNTRMLLLLHAAVQTQYAATACLLNLVAGPPSPTAQRAAYLQWQVSCRSFCQAPGGSCASAAAHDRSEST